MTSLCDKLVRRRRKEKKERGIERGEWGIEKRGRENGKVDEIRWRENGEWGFDEEKGEREKREDDKGRGKGDHGEKSAGEVRADLTAASEFNA